MDFTNDFDVEAPLDRVWTAMLDVEQVAPCVPGAQILEQTGDDAYKVGIKVKLGPITMQYRGDMEIVERDDAAHRASLARTFIFAVCADSSASTTSTSPL